MQFNAASSNREALGAALGILLPTEEEMRRQQPVDPEHSVIARRAATFPEIRSERVANLRQAIAEGRYEIDAARIADRMIGETVRPAREDR